MIFFFLESSNFIAFRNYLPTIKVGTVLKINLVFTLLNVCDVTTSMVGLASGKAIECNPLFHGSFLFFGLYKFGLCALIFVLCWAGWKRLEMEKYRKMSWVIMFALLALTIFYVAVVTNNIIVLFQIYSN